MRLNSYRIVVGTFLAILLLLFFARHELKPKIINLHTSPIISPQTHQLVTTWPDMPGRTRHLRDFWQTWAQVYEQGRPQVPDIVSGHFAANIKISTITAVSKMPFRTPPTPMFTMSEDAVTSLRDSHSVIRQALDRYNTKDVEDLFRGTGVVMVAGGEFFGPAITGIHMLRQSGSKLPVELFLENTGDYEPWLCEDYLPQLDARCLVMDQIILPTGNDTVITMSRYQLKSLALVLSSFRDVLFLDSDSIPLVAPEQDLFKSKAYTANGLVTYPDLWVATEHPDFYTIASLASFPSNLSVSCTESGQFLVDKSRHLKTLLLATYYNIYGPSHYYELLSQGALGQGDKNTFETAAVVLDIPFHRVQFPAEPLGRRTSEGWKNSAMVQMLPEPVHDRAQAAFVHANTPKMNAGHLVDEGDLMVRQEHVRLWGPAERARSIFQDDTEARVWQVLVRVGCDVENRLDDWRTRKALCARLVDHYRQVFEAGEVVG